MREAVSRLDVSVLSHPLHRVATALLMILGMAVTPLSVASADDTSGRKTELAESIISTLQYGPVDVIDEAEYARQWEEYLAVLEREKSVKDELFDLRSTTTGSIGDIESSGLTDSTQATLLERLNSPIEEKEADLEAIQSEISDLQEVLSKAELGESCAAKCMAQEEYLLTSDELCVMLKLLDLNPRICCKKALECCTNDCCVIKREQILDLINRERGKLQPDDLVMVLLLMDVSMDDVDPQRMLLALEYLNSIRFDTWVLCKIDELVKERARNPQQYPGWDQKPIPVQVLEAAAFFKVVPHDIPEELLYPMLAVGNYSAKDQENLLVIYKDTMKTKLEADVANVAYLLYQYKPERRTDLWSSFERGFKHFGKAVGSSVAPENIALSIYGGDFGLGVVSDEIRDAANSIDLAEVLKESSAVPELKTMELAAKDEVFVAAIYSLSKKEASKKTETYYWSNGSPQAYKQAKAKNLPDDASIKGVPVVVDKGDMIGTAMLRCNDSSNITKLKIFGGDAYNLIAIVNQNGVDDADAQADFTLLYVDFDKSALDKERK